MFGPKLFHEDAKKFFFFQFFDNFSFSTWLDEKPFQPLCFRAKKAKRPDWKLCDMSKRNNEFHPSTILTQVDDQTAVPLIVVWRLLSKQGKPKRKKRVFKRSRRQFSDVCHFPYSKTYPIVISSIFSKQLFAAFLPRTNDAIFMQTTRLTYF